MKSNRLTKGALVLLLLTTFLIGGCSADEAVYIRTTAMDEMTGTLVVIDSPHHEVHEGDSFFTEAVDLTLANAETLIIAFKTSAGTERVHLTGEFTTLLGGNVQVWENPTWTTNTGTLAPIYNRRREATMESSTLLEDWTATPAFTATDNVLVNVTGLNTGAATPLHHFYAFAAQGRGSSGGARDSHELILKPDTQYAIVFTSSGANNQAQMILNWYEHIDSN